jgi:hypothetical protein
VATVLVEFSAELILTQVLPALSETFSTAMLLVAW